MGSGHAHPPNYFPPQPPTIWGGQWAWKKYNSTCARRAEFVLTLRLNYGYWSAILFSYTLNSQNCCFKICKMRKFCKEKQTSLFKLFERKAIKSISRGFNPLLPCWNFYPEWTLFFFNFHRAGAISRMLQWSNKNLRSFQGTKTSLETSFIFLFIELKRMSKFTNITFA